MKQHFSFVDWQQNSLMKLIVQILRRHCIKINAYYNLPKK